MSRKFQFFNFSIFQFVKINFYHEPIRKSLLLSILTLICLSAQAQQLYITAPNRSDVFVGGSSITFTWNEYNDNDGHYYIMCGNSPLEAGMQQIGYLPTTSDNDSKSLTVEIPCNFVGINTKAIYIRIKRTKENGNKTRWGDAATYFVAGSGVLDNYREPKIILGGCEKDEEIRCFPVNRFYAPRVIVDPITNEISETTIIQAYDDRSYLWYKDADKAVSTYNALRGIPATQYDPIHTGKCLNSNVQIEEDDVFYVLIDHRCNAYDGAITLVAYIPIPNINFNPTVFEDSYKLTDDSNLQPELQCALTKLNYFPLTDASPAVLLLDPLDLPDEVEQNLSSETITWHHYDKASKRRDPVQLYSSEYSPTQATVKLVDQANRKVCASDIKRYNNPKAYRDYLIEIVKSYDLETNLPISFGNLLDGQTTGECKTSKVIRIELIKAPSVTPGGVLNDADCEIVQSMTGTGKVRLNWYDVATPPSLSVMSEEYEWTPTDYLDFSTVLKPYCDLDIWPTGLDSKRYDLKKSINISTYAGVPVNYTQEVYKCFIVQKGIVFLTGSPVEMVIFPNPAIATDKLSVRIQGVLNNVSGFDLVLFDNNQIYKNVAVTNHDLTELDISTLPNGQYFLSLVQAGNTLQTEIISIQH